MARTAWLQAGLIEVESKIEVTRDQWDLGVSETICNDI